MRRTQRGKDHRPSRAPRTLRPAWEKPTLAHCAQPGAELDAGRQACLCPPGRRVCGCARARVRVRARELTVNEETHE